MHWDSRGLLLSDKLCVIVNSRYRVYNKKLLLSIVAVPSPVVTR